VHVVASSCFIAFISACAFQFYFADVASSMQMVCSIFKVFVFLPVVFCGLGSDFVELHLFRICFLCGDSKNSVPPKNCIHAFVFFIQLKMKV